MSNSSIFLRNDTAVLHKELVEAIPGPILVLGAGGFIGANALDVLSTSRSDVVGVVRRISAWRTSHLGESRLVAADIGTHGSLMALLERERPKTIFNFSAYGAYPTQKNAEMMTRINIDVVRALGEWCQQSATTLVHSGSSSEYGTICSGPSETSASDINSLYGATKLAATSMLQAMALDGLNASVLRLYSVYGPWEEPSRLVPTLVRLGRIGQLPSFSSKQVSRDFVFVTDVLEAFWRAAAHSSTSQGVSVFNIGSGKATTMSEAAETAMRVFGISTSPVFSSNLRDWDLEQWFANPAKARDVLRWSATTSFEEGLIGTSQWYAGGREVLLQPQITPADIPAKVSAVIACYKDAQAIPVMHQRLVDTFQQIGCDYEIIFVNDSSPDESQSVISNLSKTDPHVVGVLHTRNFGSQAAFVSGLRVSTGDACVLLDGDLQDPPEVIKEFYAKFIEGFDVVYGERVSREGPTVLRAFYKLFYRVMARLSAFPVPRDAGDFSLMSRSVVNDLLSFGERELFLRTNRAYVGRRQTGVPYHRPERMFGTSTNNPMRNLQWAIRGIISSSRKPLSVLGVVGITLSLFSLLAIMAQITVRIVWPELSPPGIVSVITITGLFGSLNLLGISVIGEYVGRILEESRGRPRFIQQSVTRNGKELPAEVRDSGSLTR